MFARLKPYFKAKYFWSVFLVCGVLSISIGTPPPKDKLIQRGEELSLEFGQLFCVSRKPMIREDGQLDCGEKDPALLTEEELDGPAFYTLEESNAGLRQFLVHFEAYGKQIFEASEQRARGMSPEDPTTVNAKAKVAAQAVIDASKIYLTLQQQLFANYLRLAHESPFEMYRRTSLGSKVMSYVSNSHNPGGAIAADYAKWAEKNQAALKLKGAQAFNKNRYDYLNLRLNSQIGYEFYHNAEHGLQYNVRHARAANGSYQNVEIFLNEEDKRLIEYSALGDPRSKSEYVKLLQFAALRESMVNRWALRRLVSYDIFDPARIDRAVAACAPELVTFRVPKNSKISDAEMYQSLWQKDRYAALRSKFETIAAATHHNQFYGPLLTPEGYADLVLVYLEQFPTFRSTILPKFVGREKEMYEIIRNNPQYGRGVADQENLSWSGLHPGVGTSVAQQTAYVMNLPADSLEPAAVAERIAWKAYEQRKIYLVEALTELVRTMEFAEATTMFAPKKAVEVVEAFMSECAYAGGDPKSGCSRERVWKNSMHVFIEKAVREHVTENYPLIREQAKERSEEFLSGLRPLAVKGALGFQVRTAALPVVEEYRRKRKGGFGQTHLPSDSRWVDSGRGAVHVARSPKDYYLAKVNALKSDDLTPYVEEIPYRQSWKRSGLKQFAAPTTPAQITGFFHKKLELMSSLATPKLLKDFESQEENRGIGKAWIKPSAVALNQHGLAEEYLAVRIRSNRAVMKGMDLVFAKIAEAYSAATQEADPAKNMPAVMKMAAKANQAGKAAAPESCQKVMVLPTGAAPAPGKGVVPRGPAQELAILDAAGGQEVCVQPPVDEETANAKILESVLVSAAKAGYQEFLVQMEKTPEYKSPERAKKGYEKSTAEMKEKFREQSVVARDNTYVTPRIPTPLLITQAPSPSPLPVETRKFRPGRDQTFAMEENPVYVSPANREEAKYLMTEALGMLGLGSAATGEKWGTSTKIWFRPHRVLSWLMTEHFIQRQLPNASLLERMAGTALDQLALGQALEQEAYARAPILALQRSWRPESEKDSPNFLTRVQKYWSPQKGWDIAAFDRIFREILVTATRNDIDKVETYCRADIRNYQDDIDFRNMFNSSSGLRAALTQMKGVDKFDQAIQKEARSLSTIVLVDYIDPYGMYIFLGMMLVIGWQLSPLILSVMHASTLAAAMQTVGAAVGKLAVSKVAWLMLTGNLAPVNLVFTSQTILMVSVYFYQMPVQIEHHFQVANSQISRTSLPGFLLDQNFADREKLEAMRAELSSNQSMTKFAAVAEVAAFAGFTIPQTLKTLGFTGSRRLARLAEGIDPRILNDAKVPSFGELVKQHGGARAMEIYLGRVGVAMKSLNRIPTVLPGAASRTALYEATSAQLARHFKNRDEFVRFLEMAKDGVVKDAKLAFGFAEDAKTDVMKVAAKLREEQVSLVALRDTNEHGERFVKFLEDLPDEDYVTVVMNRNFRKVGARHQKTLAAKEAEAIQKIGEAEALGAEAEMFDKLIAAAKTSGSRKGDHDLSVFFRNMVAEGDIEKLRKYYMKYRKQVFDSNTRNDVSQVWKSLDYLKEDWSKITQYLQDHPRRAVNYVYTTGRADLYIDGPDGFPGVIDAEALKQNPEDYDTYAIPVKRLRRHQYHGGAHIPGTSGQRVRGASAPQSQNRRFLGPSRPGS